MKKYFVVLLLFIFIHCQKFDPESNDIVLLEETKEFIIYTSKENFDKNFSEWIKRHSDIDEDIKLYKAITTPYYSKNIDVYKTAKEINLLARLQYRTADLLESKKAYIYNKISKSNEDFVLEKTESDRTFKVGNKEVFYVIDIIY